MAERLQARLDMIEPGRFFVMRESENGSVTGRAYTSATEALQDLNSVAAAQNSNAVPLSLAA
jgi:hypothetical protein